MVDLDFDISHEMLEPAFRDIIQLPQSPSEKGRLTGKRCSGCGQYTIGNRIVCPNCCSEDLEEKPLSREGTLYCFSISQLAPFGFTAPLAIGMIDLPEGLRIWSQLEMDPEISLEIGIKMEMIIGPTRKDENEKEVFGFKYKPLRETR